jgi:CheY-like chemotaxis protein
MTDQGKKFKILVIDDDHANLITLANVLETWNIQADLVSSGEEALEYLRTTDDPPQAIVSDISMPIMDGTELLKIIRDDLPQYKGTTIIALTANAMPDDEEHYLNAGFDGYIAKPLSAQTFVRRVLEIRKQKSARKHEQELL